MGYSDRLLYFFLVEFESYIQISISKGRNVSYDKNKDFGFLFKSNLYFDEEDTRHKTQRSVLSTTTTFFASEKEKI